MNTVKIESINRKEALRYLAFKGDEPDENLQRLMDECEKKLTAAAKGRYTYRIFDIAENSGEKVVLSGCTLEMTGRDICAHLAGCEKAALLCATVGADVDTLIRREQVEDMASAVITDAMAGCAIEQVCDKAEEAIRESCPQMFMTWRFSAGYGDLPIELQRQFLDVTNAGRTIGVFANENNILTPKKSVTAVIGLSASPVEKKRSGCTVCKIRENCAYRKKGIRCYE
ncbi:MAG: methionine synthase [Oscillospiraceae bacterium]